MAYYNGDHLLELYNEKLLGAGFLMPLGKIVTL